MSIVNSIAVLFSSKIFFFISRDIRVDSTSGSIDSAVLRRTEGIPNCYRHYIIPILVCFQRQSRRMLSDIHARSAQYHYTVAPPEITVRDTCVTIATLTLGRKTGDIIGQPTASLSLSPCPLRRRRIPDLGTATSMQHACTSGSPPNEP